MSDKLKHQISIIEKYLKRPENQLCADCKRPQPTWASMNLGVFVCIKCSGCHREIGVHVTKIKSINLDLWPVKTLIDFGKINNKIANLYWEAGLKNFDYTKIRENDYRLQDFIRDKYEFKRWCNKNVPDPMSLVLQGHDLVKEYQINGYPKDDYEAQDDFFVEQKPVVKKKQGRSFGIVSKKDDEINNDNNIINNSNNNTTSLIDFGGDINNGNNNIIDFKKGNENSGGSSFGFINKSNSMKNNNVSLNPHNTPKQSGFGFIKKSAQNTSNLLEDFSSSQQSDLNFNLNAINNNINNNNDKGNLVDLFEVQTEKSEIVKNLNENLMNAYNTKQDPNKPNYDILNNIYNPNNNINMMNNNMMINNNMNMMNNNMMNNNMMNNNMMNNNMNYQFQNNYNMMQQRNIMNLELYNDPKKEYQRPVSQSPFVYNIDLNASKKKEDPFKNLVSFNQN